MASVNKMLVVLVSIALIVVSLSVVDALICTCNDPAESNVCPERVGSTNLTCDKETTLCFSRKFSNGLIFEACLDSNFRSQFGENARDGKCNFDAKTNIETCFCSGDLCIPPPFTGKPGEEPDKGNETDTGKGILKCNCSGKIKGHPLCPGRAQRSEWTCNESDTMCFKARTIDGAIVEGCFNSSFRKYAAKYMVTPEAGKCYYDPVSTEEICWCNSSLCVPPDFKGKGKDKAKGSAVLLRSWSWIPLSILASSAFIVVPTFVGGQ